MKKILLMLTTMIFAFSALAQDTMQPANRPNNKIQAADSEDVSEQSQKVLKISRNQDTGEIYLSGFRIVIDSKLAKTADAQKLLKILAVKLKEISRIVNPKPLAGLKQIPIWIQNQLNTDGAAWYHPNKDWLVARGYPAEMEKSVEIKCIKNFIDWQDHQPNLLLHELAHGYEDLFLAGMQSHINYIYQSALSSGGYNNVPYILGGNRRAYAMNNKTEYFAELSEAYFGKNDFYPYNRADLKEFDVAGYELMVSAWK